MKYYLGDCNYLCLDINGTHSGKCKTESTWRRHGGTVIAQQDTERTTSHFVSLTVMLDLKGFEFEYSSCESENFQTIIAAHPLNNCDISGLSGNKENRLPLHSAPWCVLVSLLSWVTLDDSWFLNFIDVIPQTDLMVQSERELTFLSLFLCLASLESLGKEGFERILFFCQCIVSVVWSVHSVQLCKANSNNKSTWPNFYILQ